MRKSAPLVSPDLYIKLSAAEKVKVAVEWLKDRHSYLNKPKAARKTWPYDQESLDAALATTSKKLAAEIRKANVMEEQSIRDSIQKNLDEFKRMFDAAVSSRDRGREITKYQWNADDLKQVQFHPDTKKLQQQYVNPGLYVIYFDVHAPWHRKPLFKAIKKFHADYKHKIVGLILGGDYLDCNSLSAHERGMKPMDGVTLGWEYEQGSLLLDELEEDLSDSITRIYLYGNHEDRYFRQMRNIDYAKINDTIMTPTAGLKLVERGYDVYEKWDQDYITLGKGKYAIDIHHGLSCSVHAAKQNLDKMKAPNASGHNHRVQIYAEGDNISLSCGFLGDLQAPVFNYASRVQKSHWGNAFLTVYVSPDGTPYPTLIKCSNDSFHYGGTFYTPH